MTGPALLAATLLSLAGAQKLVDPTSAVGALRALGMPSSGAAVRIGSAVELGLGVLAVVLGLPLLWWAVAASYIGFTAFVASALRHGTMIGSCGCFGRDDTPPHRTHIYLNLLMAAVAAATPSFIDGSILDALMGGGVRAALLVGVVTIGVYLAYATYVLLPRTLTMANSRP
ncbi:MAG: MauE/DoxX family redox-associated membrane protein [Actinomycetota bacterium]